MEKAELTGPPSVPRSVIEPASPRNAWYAPLAFVLSPTIWAASLMPSATPYVPPRVPRSVIVPLSQRNGWHCQDSPTQLSPTTCPASLIARATAAESPGSVPRSTIVNPGGVDEGGINCTVKVGAFADSLDSYAIPSEEPVERRIPSFGSPFNHAWTNGMTLTAYSPTLVGEGAGIPDFVAGEPAGLKPFHVALAWLHDSVTWETSCVVPLFLTMSSRSALTIVDPAGTWPGSGPMNRGNLIRVLQTVAEEIRHPDPSTSICGLAPKFMSGAPLAMYVSS